MVVVQKRSKHVSTKQKDKAIIVDIK